MAEESLKDGFYYLMSYSGTPEIWEIRDGEAVNVVAEDEIEKPEPETFEKIPKEKIEKIKKALDEDKCEDISKCEECFLFDAIDDYLKENFGYHLKDVVDKNELSVCRLKLDEAIGD
jgi:hypothetical protein